MSVPDGLIADKEAKELFELLQGDIVDVIQESWEAVTDRLVFKNRRDRGVAELYDRLQRKAKSQQTYPNKLKPSTLARKEKNKEKFMFNRKGGRVVRGPGGQKIKGGTLQNSVRLNTKVRPSNNQATLVTQVPDYGEKINETPGRRFFDLPKGSQEKLAKSLNNQMVRIIRKRGIKADF